MTQESKAIELVRKRGILRASTARERGIAGAVLSRLVDKGKLVRLSRGLYMLPETEVTEHHTLAEVARRVPTGIICLISALRFHELTTQMPHEVWLAIEAHSHRPQLSDLPLRIVEMSGDALRKCVDVHEVEGVPVRVTSPAKTVADCFRFRNTIGLDVAIEALRAYVHGRAGTIDELYEAARASRVRTVMQPYIEATV
jgi:predicted transcriptional regulator of viral defense system